MWTRYDAAVVREELAVLAEHGCNVTRSFCYWPDFVPEPEHLDPSVLERFQDFLDAHVETGLGTIPTFIVGHMSGQNWDPAWRAGRDLYRDVWLVSQQAWFATEITRRFAAHQAVVGWLISNEMPHYGGPATTDEITAWARILVQAVRAGGGHQPVSLGDGAWGIEVSGHDNGYSLRALGPLVDFIGPHVYPMSDDLVRQSMAAALACELSGSFGAPRRARGIRSELGLRLGRERCSLLPPGAAHEPHRGRQGMACLEQLRLRRPPGPGPLPAPPVRDAFRPHRQERQTEAAAGGDRPLLPPRSRSRRDGLGADRRRGGDRGTRALRAGPLVHNRGLPQGHPGQPPAGLHSRPRSRLAGHLRARARRLRRAAKLFLLPSAKLLMAPSAERLVELAEGGATVYLSYFPGSAPSQIGPWVPWLGELFGIRHQLRYGLVDPIEDDEVVFTFVEDLGDLTAGDELRFKVAGTESSRAFLPVEPAGATVLALDGHGRPALLRRPVGDGAMVLCTYPIEHMAARAPRVNPESTWRLYSALATSAGVDGHLTWRSAGDHRPPPHPRRRAGGARQRLAGERRGEPHDGRGGGLRAKGS